MRDAPETILEWGDFVLPTCDEGPNGPGIAGWVVKARLVPIETDEAIRSRRFVVQKNTRCLLDDGNQHKSGISKVSMKRTLKRSNLEVGMNLSLRFLVCALSLLTLTQAALAQRNCANTPNYFEPGKDTDGQRYPLAMGPLAWHLIGSGVYPVEGSDGRIHVAFAFLFTNAWRRPTTIQSVEVVDPSQNNQRTGTNRVLSIKDEDVTNEIRPFGADSNGDKAGYSKKLDGGQSGVMYFDVTYADSSDVPCSVALRVHSVQPEIKVMPESTLLSPLLLSSQTPIEPQVSEACIPLI